MVSWGSLTHKMGLPCSEPFQWQGFCSFACPHHVVVAEHKSILPDLLTTTKERFLFHKSGLSIGKEPSSAFHCYLLACIPVGILNTESRLPVLPLKKSAAGLYFHEFFLWEIWLEEQLQVQSHLTADHMYNQHFLDALVVAGSKREQNRADCQTDAMLALPFFYLMWGKNWVKYPNITLKSLMHSNTSMLHEQPELLRRWSVNHRLTDR